MLVLLCCPHLCGPHMPFCCPHDCGSLEEARKQDGDGGGSDVIQERDGDFLEVASCSESEGSIAPSVRFGVG